MKKITSLLLALVMVFSMSTVAFASGFGSDECMECGEVLVLCSDCNVEYCSCDPCNCSLDSGEYETLVSYTGDGVSAYEVTVPATLAPGGSGKVKVSGTWATNMTVVVTAPETVTLTNDIDGSTKVLDVEFDGISQAGDNTNSILVSQTISVEQITNALFGTWEGTIVYNVTTEDNGSGSDVELISFTIFGDSYQAEEGMTWNEWIASDYNTGGFYLNNNYAGGPVRHATGYVGRESSLVVLGTHTIISEYNYVEYFENGGGD